MHHSIVYNSIDIFFWIFMLMLMVRILSSWFSELADHPIIRFVSVYTDPYLNFFRRFIPPLGMFDLSPIIAFFALGVIEWILKALFA